MDTDATPNSPVDPALAARLERLSTRNAPPGPGPTRGGTGKRRRRRHAAKRSRAAALALSLSTAGGLTYAFAAMDAAAPAAAAQAAAVVVPSGSSSTDSELQGGVVAAGSSGGSSTTAAPTTAATNTLVSGAVYPNKWGNVQVQVEFAPDGSLASVETLQTPTKDGKSVQINNRAVPTLASEALAAQNADVQSVSGATYTSQGFQASLQSAIDAARASGITAIA